MEQIKVFSRSVKKFIRTQKAQIRRQFWDVKKQNEGIAEMYKKMSQQPVKLAEVVKPAAKPSKDKKVKNDKNK